MRTVYWVIETTQINGTVVIFEYKNKQKPFLSIKNQTGTLRMINILNWRLYLSTHIRDCTWTRTTYTIHILGPIECVRTNVNYIILELKKQQNYFQINWAHVLKNIFYTCQFNFWYYTSLNTKNFPIPLTLAVVIIHVVSHHCSVLRLTRYCGWNK